MALLLALQMQMCMCDMVRAICSDCKPLADLIAIDVAITLSHVLPYRFVYYTNNMSEGFCRRTLKSCPLAVCAAGAEEGLLRRQLYLATA